LGVGSARLLRSPSLMKRFNQGMALLLLASAWAALLL
ncbi:TPA: LysE family translocator, partial [Pseudomonas aeruginosa]|nr:LysE family translocator [Pseudomonas aeruginosa]HDY5555156.1 LysE family translocator [Pseudomonas aeruginosa]